MSTLISVSKLEKTMGSKLLFEDLSLGVFERQRVGLLGPNGAGKSTLLKILAGLELPDQGEVSKRKGLALVYVPQEEVFPAEGTVLDTAIGKLRAAGMDADEALIQAPIHLSLVGFTDHGQCLSVLSGGWKKRLSLAIAFAQEPELLLLDEPTNHMDWEGILWLEDLLQSFKGAFVLVSHDRAFLNSLCNRTVEINRLYRDGYLSFDCRYEDFLVKKEEYIQTQLTLQESLSNKARREIDWLRAGVKARTTKSQSRIKEAHQLIDNLADVKARNQAGKARIRLEIESGGKQSKKLMELKAVGIQFSENPLVSDLNLVLGPKSCLGVLGSNGSGKSSLLKILAGQLSPSGGELVPAEKLQIVYFDQKREDLPQDIDLIEYLGDGSDYTLFKGQSVHVASYASRFLFQSEKMRLKISQLSGGEQARLLIAKLLLQPADVLLLDEPTNDLDIDSIEVLEQALLSFEGLVVLVSHDRQFLNNLCTRFLALDGKGSWQVYADLHQWLRDRQTGSTPLAKAETKSSSPESRPAAPQKVRLSYNEKRQLETIEEDIEKAEQDLQQAQADLESPEVYSDHKKMADCVEMLNQCQKKIDDLYALWEKGSQ
ncbi:MAG: ABC-F family ATP-binding cassette domain-containing protein [Bdellovibrionaceae bacterium]|nr:ABC-F family ATP-binding cassette domain-containing protein [Bdellovibrionales bacterium]MCB9082850.1 ABC-F family ATP-binding cassette domain-containing protein [Pseudobdellovibrionaceae bacterium]